jgi:type IV pilus assembly protein PilY1
LLFNNGTAGRDLNGDGKLDTDDVAVTLSGGGLPPSPVAGLVSVLDAATNKTVVVPFVIGAGGVAGAASGLPSQSAPARINLNLSKARKKTYWYLKSNQ